MKARKRLDMFRQAKTPSRRGSDLVRRHDQGTEPTRNFDHFAHDGRALDVIGVENVLRRLSSDHRDELPRKIDRVLHAPIHAPTRERRHEVRRVTREKYASDPPPIGDAGMEGVDCLAFDFESIETGLALDEGADGVVALQLFLVLAGQLHEFPTNPIAYRGQFDRGSARVASEGDSFDVVVLDDRVDDEPALRVGRARKLDAEPFPDAARSPVAGDDVGRAHFEKSAGGRNPDCNAAPVLLEFADGMLEGDGDSAETRQPLEQDLLEIRLIESAERRMAVDALRGLDRHERLAPRIEMADMRVSHEARRDLLEKPDLSEKT